ncbi:MAG TPA: DUF2520 domain-containing protein [Candidatus Kryptobacter bacterium]|nr:DUF2520 domain-containing protein [Candidatus Kryptobacter bacterium]
MRRSGVSFSIVGPGRVGSSLAKALVQEGWHCDSIVGQTGGGLREHELSRRLPGVHLVDSISSLGPDFDLLFLTVTDDHIGRVASELAVVRGIDWTGKTVLHTSGIVTVASLRKLKLAGAHTGALHPIAPFATPFSPRSARNIYYDFLGDDASRKLAFRVTKDLSSKLLVMRSERDRALLHISSVILSNFTVIGALTAEELLSDFILKKDIKMLSNRLLSSTFNNLNKAHGVSGLTGPLARGDLGIIGKHLKSLENNSALLQFYRSASLLGIRALLKAERRPARRKNLLEIKKLLEG